LLSAAAIKKRTSILSTNAQKTLANAGRSLNRVNCPYQPAANVQTTSAADYAVLTASAPAASPTPPQVFTCDSSNYRPSCASMKKLAAEAAREGLDHARFLLRLAELELIDRKRRMVERRIRVARFPAVKSCDTFDFAAIPSLNKPLVLELARLANMSSPAAIPQRPSTQEHALRLLRCAEIRGRYQTNKTNHCTAPVRERSERIHKAGHLVAQTLAGFTHVVAACFQRAAKRANRRIIGGTIGHVDALEAVLAD
jgi:IstB-like ATP binding protein